MHILILQDLQCYPFLHPYYCHFILFFFFFLINLFILFIYFWLCWVFVAASGATLGCGARLLIAVASLVAEHGLQARGLQQLQCVSSVVVARGLQSTGSVVVVHGLSCSAARSSWTRAQTRVPCIGRRILNHCATREVPILFFLISFMRGLSVLPSFCLY